MCCQEEREDLKGQIVAWLQTQEPHVEANISVMTPSFLLGMILSGVL